MGVKIGNNAKIGDNNAIGDNAYVSVNDKKDNKTKSNELNWFTRHPWLSAILCSIIAGIILLFSFWGNAIKYIEGLIK